MHDDDLPLHGVSGDFKSPRCRDSLHVPELLRGNHPSSIDISRLGSMLIAARRCSLFPLTDVMFKLSMSGRALGQECHAEGMTQA